MQNQTDSGPKVSVEQISRQAGAASDLWVVGWRIQTYKSKIPHNRDHQRLGLEVEEGDQRRTGYDGQTAKPENIPDGIGEKKEYVRRVHEVINISHRLPSVFDNRKFPESH